MAAIEIEVTPEQREKNAAKCLKDIEKAHGAGSVVQMGNRVGHSMPSISTGIYEVDYEVIGCGGFPRGRICEVYGPESGGKTTLALMTIAQCQKAGGRAAFIDAEHALDPNWATLLGVNMDELIVSQPDYGEQALSIAEMMLESCAFDIVVVDSVAALVPKSELDGDMGDSNMGVHARLMSQAMRKLTGVTARSNAVMLFINQIREKIGVMFGSPETTTGGRALKFFSSVRLDVRRIGQYKEGELVLGNKTKIKGAKNKVGAPFTEREINLLWGSGFDADGSVFDAALASGLIEKSGAWYSMKGERLGQGRTNSIETVRNSIGFDALRKELRKDAA